MSLPPSGLPSTVTLPVTSARRSPQPAHASNAAKQRKPASRGRGLGRTLSLLRPRVKDDLHMVRLAWTTKVRARAKVLGTSGDDHQGAKWRIPRGDSGSRADGPAPSFFASPSRVAWTSLGASHRIVNG